MKLYVLPPSISICTGFSRMCPNNRNVLGAKWPESVCRLIWVGAVSGVPYGSEAESKRGISGGISSSLSMIRRKALKTQWWPWWNFSSQLKQRSRFLCEVISSEVRRLMRSGGGFGGEGSNDGPEEMTGGGEGECDEWPSSERWRSRNFSSCKRAKPTAWANVWVTRPGPRYISLVSVPRQKNSKGMAVEGQ